MNQESFIHCYLVAKILQMIILAMPHGGMKNVRLTLRLMIVVQLKFSRLLMRRLKMSTSVLRRKVWNYLIT